MWCGSGVKGQQIQISPSIGSKIFNPFFPGLVDWQGDNGVTMFFQSESKYEMQNGDGWNGEKVSGGLISGKTAEKQEFFGYLATGTHHR